MKFGKLGIKEDCLILCTYNGALLAKSFNPEIKAGNLKVKKKESKEYVKNNLYYEVSSKTGNNISLAFEQLACSIIEKQIEEEKNPDKVLRGVEARKTTGLKDVPKIEEKKKKKKKDKNN